MSISRVQANANRAASATSISVTLTSGVVQGNLLVALVSAGSATATWTTPTGWTLDVNGSGVNTGVSIYHMVVPAGTAGTTSFTFTASGSFNLAIAISEWASTTGWPASPLDKTASASGASQTTVSSGTTATTTQASELWIAGLGYSSTVQTESGLTTGWTLGVEASGGPNLREVYEIASATGAASASFTITTAANVAGAVATFIPSAAAPSPVLSLSPTSLSFSGVQGGSNPASQNTTLSETAGTGTAWTSSITYGSGSGWLSLSPASGTLAASGNTSISVSVSLSGLVAGTYTATATFTATTGGSTATVSVTLVVSASSGVPSASPTTLTFTAKTGGASPITQNVTLTNTGPVSDTWKEVTAYTSGNGWLSVSSALGVLGAGASTTIAFRCSVGTLPVGTYTATATFTMGVNHATVSVTFVVTAFSITSFTILMAGQDITAYVDQMSLQIGDTLGQGSGAGSSGSTQGRASTLKFNTTLGPLGTAVGAGQALPPGGPWLVRQGEVRIYDAAGNLVFGGFSTKFTDTTTALLGQTRQNFTTVEGIDYSTSLQRTLVNEVFTGATDIDIIRFVLQKYVGWVKLDYLPTTAAYTFATKTFHNQSVEQVLQTIAGITGYLVYVDYNKYIRYTSPTVAASTPFSLSSNPDFVTTFPHAVEEYVVDDTSAINRVFFYGGTKTSNDFWQDISPLVNGSNLVFPLAYYPSPMADGKYHIKTNGVDSTIKTSTSGGPSGQFISQGGTATVLLDPGARTIAYDTGYAPASGTTLLAGYRYSLPLSLVITDENSHRYFGDPYLDGYVNDNTIFDLMTGIQRCRVLLAQQSYGLVTLKVLYYNKPGIQAGMIVHIYNQLRGLNGSYLVQEVQTSPLGGGNFVYHLTLGAWNWNLLDFLLKLPGLSTFQDDQTQSQEQVTIAQILSGVSVHDAWSTRTTVGPYYARATAVGDGHDAYPGFSTISS